MRSRQGLVEKRQPASGAERMVIKTQKANTPRHVQHIPSHRSPTVPCLTIARAPNAKEVIAPKPPINATKVKKFIASSRI